MDIVSSVQGDRHILKQVHNLSQGPETIGKISISFLFGDWLTRLCRHCRGRVCQCAIFFPTVHTDTDYLMFIADSISFPRDVLS